MVYAPNSDRNRSLINKRISDPKKWTWAKLGQEFNLHRSVSKQIFERDVEKYAKEDQIERYQRLIDTLNKGKKTKIKKIG
ncbi:MAG: hypothetical protein M3Q73_02875 [bacterium]|nr:hypothetical protein [bacterium]